MYYYKYIIFDLNEREMNKTRFSSIFPIRLVLWSTIFFSTEGLVYYIRWFIPFLKNHTANVVPLGRMPLLWFLVQSEVPSC